MISERKPAFRAEMAAVNRRDKPKRLRMKRAKGKSGRALRRGGWESSDDEASSSSDDGEEDDEFEASEEEIYARPKEPRRLPLDRAQERKAAADAASPASAAAVASHPVSKQWRVYDARKTALCAIGAPRCITPVGWAALVQTPRGFLSLDVRHNLLSYESYMLLLAHVTHLRAGVVKSPAEEAEAKARELAKRQAWNPWPLPAVTLGSLLKGSGV